MAVGDIIVGIDIGTSKVSTVVGEVNNFNQIEIICSTNCKCSGIQKGIILDEEQVASAIHKTIKEAEEISNLKINSAYTTIPGQYITIVQNSIVKETKEKYAGITLKDVTQAIMQVRDIEIPEDKVLIDIVPDKFILDDGKPVSDPIGKFSSSLTLTAQIILLERDLKKKLVSIFKRAGIDIDGIVPITLAERNLVLDSNELRENVMILDIGAGNTEIGVFLGSSYVYSNTINLRWRQYYFRYSLLFRHIKRRGR